MIDYTQHGDLQRGGDIDVLFDINENTASFVENDYYPRLVVDYRDIKLHIDDYLENGLAFDQFDPDGGVEVCFKNGSILCMDATEVPTVSMKKKLTPIIHADTKKRPLFVIVSNADETMFWFNGWQGLLALQEYTGWFDMTIYQEDYL